MINFKFKKPGFKKLIIFDLDETLIHCKREDPEDNDSNLSEDGEKEDEGTSLYKFKPDIWLDIYDPTTNEDIKIGFSVRPYAIECLKQANTNYEVAIFTGAQDWYANPILDYLDPTGELI